MKNKSLVVLSILSLILLTLSSCKKYEEGPWISLRTKNARLVGKWKLEKFTETRYQEDNNGSTTSYTTFDGNYWIFENNNPMEYSQQMLIEKGGTYRQSITFNNEAKVFTGFWSWEDGKSNKSMIKIGREIFTIIKLKNDELKLFNLEESTNISGNNKQYYSTKLEYTYSKQD